MTEVFKTDVEDKQHALALIDIIHQAFPRYRANFDLEDCDNILRLFSTDIPVESFAVINLLNEYGYNAEILEDEIITLEYFAEERARPA